MSMLTITPVHAMTELNEANAQLPLNICVTPEYDALESEIRFLLNSGEGDSTVFEKQQLLVDQQIMILNREIALLEAEIADYVEFHDELKSEMDAKQTKLEFEHGANVQKIKTIGANLVDSCVNAQADKTSLRSIVNKISTVRQLASNDNDTVSEINEIDSERQSVEMTMQKYEIKLFTFRKLLVEKRYCMYDLLYAQKEDLKHGNIGNLINQTDLVMIDAAFDQNGVMWVSPCVYKRLSSPFGYRIHPVYNEWKMHNGVDLTNKSKTPIYAVRSGVVIDSGYDPSSGYHVIIDHLDGYKSYYLHLYAKSELKVGDVIVIGDYIGPMGTTGVSTGTHLHFGISYKSNWVDPMDYIN
jgi:murein DD-endopeptidase MepM/ murein hydrolase activator NlpD